MIPMLQVSADAAVCAAHAGDLDLEMDGSVSETLQALLGRISATASRTYEPKLTQLGNVSFQLTRGEFGISL